MNYELTKVDIKNLKDFEVLFLKWQKTINLISKNSVPFLWQRHILDSVQLYPYVKNKVVLDLGSGGGFPALIMAILAKENCSAKFFLAERDERKAAFLREVIRKFSLNAEVVNKSIENINPFKFDVITSRALAEIEKILTLSSHLLQKNSILFLMKGRNADIEIKQALLKYNFDFEKIASKTDLEANIIKIFNINIKE